ncbi:hypothetical protein J6590_071698 [Homalodisca vitripennis]|nr:hypothetical protein J6590_071698 [Homalodisca vitripennis]
MRPAAAALFLHHGGRLAAEAVVSDQYCDATALRYVKSDTFSALFVGCPWVVIPRMQQSPLPPVPCQFPSIAALAWKTSHD